MGFKIGNVEVKNRVVFAPMAGVSNISFRTIIKEMGAGLIYSEMISSMGIKYGSSKTIDLINFNREERPISIQIFGNDIESFVHKLTSYLYIFFDEIHIKVMFLRSLYQQAVIFATACLKK